MWEVENICRNKMTLVDFGFSKKKCREDPNITSITIDRKQDIHFLIMERIFLLTFQYTVIIISAIFLLLMAFA